MEKSFIDRNFGIFRNTRYHHGWDAFDIPKSLEASLSRGEVPQEVHEGFIEKGLEEKGIPFSQEVFSKESVQKPGNWAIIDKENNGIHYN